MEGNGSSLFLLPFLTAAAWFDWRERRIPNWVTGFGLAAGLTLAAAGGAAAEMVLALLRACAAVALAGGLYILRMVGAGDVKLMAVIVCWLGMGEGGAGIFTGICLGAAWSLGKLLRSGSLAARLRYFRGYIRRFAATGQHPAYYRRERDGEEIVIPLGACIAVGSGAVVIVTSIMNL